MSERNENTQTGRISDDDTCINWVDSKEVEREMEMFRKCFTRRLRLDGTPIDNEPVRKVLKEVSLDGIVDYIKEHENCKIITVSGAGISTSAGISDFRSPQTGLYHNLKKYNLPDPEAIFELNYFIRNPKPFFAVVKELLPGSFKPTPAHYFIRLLSEKGLLLRHYTQNIDTLERMAGLPAEKLVEAHGTFHTGRCLKCKAPYLLPWMKKKIMEGTVPKCEECKEGVVKPDIVFFGEMLPERFHRVYDRDFEQADLLIIMGSSLVVNPFAQLVNMVRPNCPRLLINKEDVGPRLSRTLKLEEGSVYDSRTDRDVIWLGDCDTGCQLLAEKLGWKDELKDLIKREHERLEKESAD